MSSSGGARARKARVATVVSTAAGGGGGGQRLKQEVKSPLTGDNSPSPATPATDPAAAAVAAGKGGSETPIEATGVYADAKYTAMLSSVIGCDVIVLTISCERYQGILESVSPDNRFVLRMATRFDPLRPDHIDVSSLQKTLMFSCDKVVTATAMAVDLEYACRSGSGAAGAALGFQTDTAIAGRSGGASNGLAGGGVRELQPWVADDAAGGDSVAPLLTLGSANGWDAHEMFRTNELHYGVRSTYDDSLAGYTTAVAPASAQLESQAARIASEIERLDTSGHRQSLNGAEPDEEQAFAAVARSTGAATDTPAASSGSAAAADRYIPPSRRALASAPPPSQQQQQQSAASRHHLHRGVMSANTAGAGDRGPRSRPGAASGPGGQRLTHARNQAQQQQHGYHGRYEDNSARHGSAKESRDSHRHHHHHHNHHLHHHPHPHPHHQQQQPVKQPALSRPAHTMRAVAPKSAALAELRQFGENFVLVDGAPPSAPSHPPPPPPATADVGVGSAALSVAPAGVSTMAVLPPVSSTTAKQRALAAPADQTPARSDTVTAVCSSAPPAATAAAVTAPPSPISTTVSSASSVTDTDPTLTGTKTTVPVSTPQPPPAAAAAASTAITGGTDKTAATSADQATVLATSSSSSSADTPTVAKSKLNPNAKVFTPNPNAKTFTPSACLSVTTPTRTTPPTPTVAQYPPLMPVTASLPGVAAGLGAYIAVNPQSLALAHHHHHSAGMTHSPAARYHKSRGGGGGPDYATAGSLMMAATRGDATSLHVAAVTGQPLLAAHPGAVSGSPLALAPGPGPQPHDYPPGSVVTAGGAGAPLIVRMMPPTPLPAAYHAQHPAVSVALTASPYEPCQPPPPLPPQPPPPQSSMIYSVAAQQAAAAAAAAAGVYQYPVGPAGSGMYLLPAAAQQLQPFFTTPAGVPVSMAHGQPFLFPPQPPPAPPPPPHHPPQQQQQQPQPPPPQQQYQHAYPALATSLPQHQLHVVHHSQP